MLDAPLLAGAAGVVVGAALTLVLGVAPAPLLNLAEHSALFLR